MAFVTEDKWMREDGGMLDPTDSELLIEASQGGKFSLRVMNIREMLETMARDKPGDFEAFKRDTEKELGCLIPLSFDDLVELSRKGSERMNVFVDTVASMNLGQAVQIRHWRVDNHMTWRSVARAAFEDGFFLSNWDPLSNQLMGMALCERAAQMFKENYEEEPWN